MTGYLIRAYNLISFFQRYLLPQAATSSGLTTEQVQLTDEALRRLIRQYCRESGVRNLQKHVEKVSSLFSCSTSVSKLYTGFVLNTIDI